MTRPVPLLEPAPIGTAPPGLRERKRLRTERDLRQAALELFGRHGYDGVTIDDIAEAADVSKRTFYRYFDAKEDVLFADPAERIGQLHAAFAARPADEGAFATARRAILRLAERYEDERDELAARMRIVRSTPSLVAHSLEQQERWATTLAGALAERLDVADDDLMVQLVAANLIATLRVTLEYWLEHEQGQSLRELVAASLARLELGFGRLEASES